MSTVSIRAEIPPIEESELIESVILINESYKAKEEFHAINPGFVA